MNQILKIALGVAGGIGIVIAIGMIIFFIANFDHLNLEEISVTEPTVQYSDPDAYCNELLEFELKKQWEKDCAWKYP